MTHVINGIEVAGGSIRIHQRDVQALNFKALGLTPEKARERFGFFLEALEYGTPPHGGFAAGIERTLMALLQTDNIRDLIAFPKTASAQDLMMDSPGEVDEAQLKELGIKIVSITRLVLGQVIFCFLRFKFNAFIFNRIKAVAARLYVSPCNF